MARDVWPLRKLPYLLDAMAGRFQATGTLVDFGKRTEGKRALALIDVDVDLSRCQDLLRAAAPLHWALA